MSRGTRGRSAVGGEGRQLLELFLLHLPEHPREGTEMQCHPLSQELPKRRSRWWCVALCPGWAWVSDSDVFSSGSRGASHPRAKARERRVIFFF